MELGSFLLGILSVKSESLEEDGEEGWQLKQSFNVRDHSGAIRYTDQCITGCELILDSLLDVCLLVPNLP